MNERRSIQDIIPPARSKPIRASLTQTSEVVKPPPKAPETPPLPPRPQKPPANHTFMLMVIAFGVLLIIGAAFALVSTLFHRAEVSVVLSRYSVPVAETFTATPDGVLLSYTEKSVETELSTSVPQSGSEPVEERASGTILIYNAYSTKSQRLITNTRFETPGGLIYRIQSPVTVPGYKTVNGERVPGEVEATVYADEPGEKYNIGATDFTIPGLKGSPQFEAMYARSKGTLSGGFVGQRAKVEKSVRDSALSTLRSDGEVKAREAFIASLSPNELLLSSDIAVEFVEQPDIAGDSEATVRLKAIAKAPVFLEDKLASLLASEAGVRAEGSLEITNLKDLSILLEKSKTSDALSVTLSGTAELVGVIDRNRLLQDLAGKDQRDVGVVLSGYPAIADMKVSVYPFWRGTIPEELSKINLSLTEGVDTP